MDAAVGAAGPHDPLDVETGAGRKGRFGKSGGRSRARQLGPEWLDYGTTGAGSAHEPGQIAAFGLLQGVVADDPARLLQPAEQSPDPSADGRSPTGPSSTRNEPDNAARARLGLGPQKAFGVGHGFDNALAM